MKVYENLWASTLKFCNDFANRAQANGLSPDIEVYDFDAMGGFEALPETDLIGPADFQVETRKGLFYITTMVGITTENDLNGFRLNKLVAELFNKLLPEQSFPYVDAETGGKIGKMKVMDGTSVLPMARNSKSRPLKMIAVEVGTDRAVPGLV